MSSLPSKTVLQDLFLDSVQAVSVIKCLENIFRYQPETGTLVVKGLESPIKVSSESPCHVVGFGKAVLGMACELEKLIGKASIKSGVISIPVGQQKTFQDREDMKLDPDSAIRIFEGAKDNIPDDGSRIAAEHIEGLVTSLQHPSDILFVLISGGGSALLPAPVPPITLQEKSDLIRALSRSGATITELNTVRKQLSTLKGGQLALKARPAKVIALILSDIIGDPLDFISSAPTVKSTDTVEDVWKILDRLGLKSSLPDSIRQVLATKSKDDNEESFSHVQNVLIGNNAMAVDAAVAKALELGFAACGMSSSISGEAKIVGKVLAELGAEISRCIESDFVTDNISGYLKDLQFSEDQQSKVLSTLKDANGKPVCLVCGGETVVKVVGNGKGGRNQEMALSFSLQSECSNVWFLSAGTDGIDGPTPAAGAIGHCRVVEQAKELGIDPFEFLENNDSFTFFQRVNGGRNLITTGHTGTNVMDIQLLCIFP